MVFRDLSRDLRLNSRKLILTYMDNLIIPSIDCETRVENL